MSTRVKVEISKGKIDLIKARSDAAQRLALEKILEDSKKKQYTPKDTGRLERSGYVEKTGDGYRIEYSVPYALRLYFHPEFHFRTHKNKNARGLWLQSYVDGPDRDVYEKWYVQGLVEGLKFK